LRRNLDARLARVARAKIAVMPPSGLAELHERLRFGARVSIHAALREQLARLDAGSTPSGEPVLGDAVAAELAGILDTFERCGIDQAVLDFEQAAPDAFESAP
jgi:hypothetical protein